MGHLAEVAMYPQLGKNGRLANQLFQIAVTMAYAKDTNKVALFPEWGYSDYFQAPLNSVDGKTIDNLKGEATHHQFPFHYEAIPNIPGIVSLHGHGQTEKYFKHHADLVRKQFRLKEEHYRNALIQSIALELEEGGWRRTCAVHIRRTDYDTPTNREYHGLMPITQYYYTAAKRLYEDWNEPLFIIFSDDLDWCKNNICFPNQVFSTERDEIIDLFIMSLCDDFIIANSSYSWWGAWLAESHDKRVAYPYNWFNNAPLNTKDVGAEGWHKIYY